MEESSSSDSQAPDYEKMAGMNSRAAFIQHTLQHCVNPPPLTSAEFPVPPFLDVLKHTDGASSPPEHPDLQNKAKSQQSSDNKQHDAHGASMSVIMSGSISTCFKCLHSGLNISALIT